jgi:DNA-binding PadR family transcriptional regulator
VVLGLVAVRPTAGHELAAFASRSVANFFPLTRSHVYLELDRLCRLGYLHATEVAQDRLPNKRVYEIMPAGLVELGRWLHDDGDLAPDRTRSLFLVRVFFGDRMSPDGVASLLDRYEAGARAARDRLAEVVDRLADSPDALFRRSTAMYGVRHEQAKLDWVAEVRPLLLAAAAAADPELPDSADTAGPVDTAAAADDPAAADPDDPDDRHPDEPDGGDTPAAERPAPC